MTEHSPPTDRTALDRLITGALAPVLSAAPIPLWALRPILLRDNRHEAAGGWERLRSADEAGRYWMVRGALHAHARAGSVLDIGCGSGILLDGLDCAQYTGVDNVPSAFGGADLAPPPHARFVVADASVYAPEQRYDAVVFNECLYYLADPVAVVERMCGVLEPGGVVVISCYARAWALRRLLRATAAVAPVAAQFTVSSSSFKRWTVQVLRPTVVGPNPHAGRERRAWRGERMPPRPVPRF